LPSFYAIVRDVPASWEDYPADLAAMGDSLPDGLLVHVAGPTDEGFRLIDVWQSKRDCERFLAKRPPAVPQTAHTTTRELTVAHLCLRDATGATVDKPKEK
jgi:hypothetical protein